MADAKSIAEALVEDNGVCYPVLIPNIKGNHIMFFKRLVLYY